MAKYIGRQTNVGFGKESSRGTAVAATFWAPAMEFAYDDKVLQVVNESSLGVIEDADNASVVRKFAEGEITGKLSNEGWGTILVASLGDEATPTLVETGVYDHDFSVGQSAQHPSLTISISDPVSTGASGLRFPLAMVDSLEVNAEVERFVTYTASFRSNSKENDTNTPSYVDENVFLPQYCEIKLYADWTNLQGDTGGTVYPFKRLTLTISKNIEDDQVLGDVDVADRLNKQFQVEGTLELLYENRDFVDTILLGDLAKAMRIKMINTAVTIGATSNPEFEIDLAKVKISEVARDITNNDLVRQTITFKAFYDTTNSVMLEARLRNTLATAY